MKISYIADFFSYGGTETAIKNRMDYLKTMGVESQFISLWKSFEDDMFGEYKHFVTDSPREISTITKNSDLVIIVSPYISDKLQALDKNMVIESHYGEAKYLKKQLSSKRVKAAIFPTRARLNEAKPYIPEGIPAFIIPNCLGKSFIKKAAIQQHHLKNDKKVILWVGRIQEFKNWMILPKLAERLPDNYKIIVIAGVAVGYQMQNYKEFLETFKGKPYSNKIEPIINCPYNKMVDYYLQAAASGCYLSTSYLESFGMTVLEAMSSSCPLVLSNLACFKEVAGDSALYFNPNDIDACLNSIITICNDASIRASKLSKMKNIYELNFNPIKICNDYVNALHSIID